MTAKQRQQVDIFQLLLEDWAPRGSTAASVSVDGRVAQLGAFMGHYTDPMIATCLAAALEALLYQAVERALRPGRTASSLVDQGGPLSSAAAQANLLYCLGLIDRPPLGRLQKIAAIRNQFAHSPTARSFDESTIAKLCLELPENEIPFTAGDGSLARRRFISSALEAAFHLQVTIQMASWRNSDEWMKEWHARDPQANWGLPSETPL